MRHTGIFLVLMLACLLFACDSTGEKDKGANKKMDQGVGENGEIEEGDFGMEGDWLQEYQTKRGEVASVVDNVLSDFGALNANLQAQYLSLVEDIEVQGAEINARIDEMRVAAKEVQIELRQEIDEIHTDFNAKIKSFNEGVAN